MKIYYEPPSQISEIDEVVEASHANTPPELAHIINPLTDMLRKFYSEKLIMQFDLIKYKIMWALRFIEQEIESEDGHFKIKNDGGMELVDFSPTLMEKIKKEMAAHYKK